MEIRLYGYSTFDVQLSKKPKLNWNHATSRLTGGFLFFFSILAFTCALFTNYSSIVSRLRLKRKFNKYFFPKLFGDSPKLVKLRMTREPVLTK